MSVLNILEEKLAETKKQGRFREFLNLERGVQDKTPGHQPRTAR